MESLTEIQNNIGYRFKDTGLLRQALTHSSYSNEQRDRRVPDYERLEFLGDAVLEMVSSARIYDTFPDDGEGEMTRLRASLVCESALSSRARSIGLADHILLGRGEESTGGRRRDSIISDVMEALIGAIYLDGGTEEAASFINRVVLTNLEKHEVENDAKSTLQEMLQAKGLATPRYEITGEQGPEHDKTFMTAVYLGDTKLGEGSGKTKKSAQQQAARSAVEAINNGEVCI